jgi:hypothetical protein
MYKTVIRPIVTYACETWILTRKDELTIITWERMVLRRIFGPICQRGCYRMRTNEVYRLYQALDLVTIIKTQAEMARPCKRDGRSQGIPGGGRRRGNPRKTDDVEDDLSKTGAKQRMKAVDMTDWRKI